MKFSRLFFMVVLIVAFWDPGEAKKVKDNTYESATEPQAIVQGIIDGISTGDYAMYSRHFSELMRTSQKREDFLNLQKKLQKTLGKLLSLDSLGFYVQRGNIITLFKAKFSKEKDDVLIKLVLQGSASEPKVAGLWFDSPALEK
ncbi:MAG: hypothetical protein NTW27_00860 [Deltaproteobacteria bacterium]|jgi:hypothetical protein|nr:hypothetical protein [Deltaproteobacteria bacterium]